MRILTAFSLIVGKLAALPIQLFSLGSGSTWPGHIVLQFNKNFVRNILKQNPQLKIVLVAGTNGKTTTTTLMRFLLEKNNVKVFQNEEGANLINGIASNLIKNSNIFGKIDFDAALFEVDENAFPLAVEQTSPSAILILNLFRDQLDRYGEVDVIARKWRESLKQLPKESLIYLNADDPQVFYLGSSLAAPVTTFGLSSKFLTKKETSHDVDSIYCPKCGNKLTYNGISYSHLGDYHCSNCNFKRKVTEMINEDIKSPLHGIYNLYNSFATIKLINKLFSIPEEKLKKQITSFKPPFGRQEEIDLDGKKAFLILSKNPTGFNQSIEVISKKIKRNKDNLLVVLNDRVPDGHDISWIWDVDFEKLGVSKNLFLSGDRVYDLALRMKYAGMDNFKTGEDLQDIIREALDKTDKGSTLYVLPTYSGMLDIRKILSGRKLL